MHDATAAHPTLLPPQPTRLSHPDVYLAMTVNDALRRIPNAGLVFNAFGVDACCGGANTLDAAARAAGLDPEILLDALVSVLVEPTADARRAAEGAR